MTRTPPHAHWSRYWAAGALTSLSEDFAGNYDGEVARFWHDRFSELTPPASLLDLCTGNGPIALLAAAWAQQHAVSLAVTAVDAAQPRPDLAPGLSAVERQLVDKVRFLGDTPVERLPFDDQSFDLVTSQYGLEYCDLAPAAAQVYRVLKPGAMLVMVTHAADSEMVKTMQDEMEGYRRLGELKLLKLLRAWSRGQLAEPDFERRARNVLTQLQRSRTGASRSPLVMQVAQALNSLLQMPVSSRRAQREPALTYTDDLLAGEARLQDMLRVNRMIAEDDRWYAPLEKAGLVLEKTQPLVYRGEHAMGQTMQWRRPA